MTTIIYAWRAIFWSWVAASCASRAYMSSDDCAGHADALLKEFDQRFEVKGSGSILPTEK